jgi:hypothetical protein
MHLTDEGRVRCRTRSERNAGGAVRKNWIARTRTRFPPTAVLKSGQLLPARL